MNWAPKPFWKGRDVHIIGGGDSLRTFDWKLLQDLNTIGCNSAYLLGSGICKICVFGDMKFWKHNRTEVEKYARNNLVVTNAPALIKADEIPWLKTMRRMPRGFHTDALGWNGNTGAVAINLALILGAKRIFLLGFDMELNQETGEPNWHDNRNDEESPEVYPRFISGFSTCVPDLENKFPGCDIINLNPDSKLEVFPKMSLEEHFAERTA